MAYGSAEEAVNGLYEERNCVRPEDDISAEQQIKVTVNIGKLLCLGCTPT